MSWLVPMIHRTLSVMLNGNGQTAEPSRGLGRCKDLCNENGWPINEQNGDQLGLYFNVPNGRQRTLCLCSDKSGEIVMFCTRVISKSPLPVFRSIFSFTCLRRMRNLAGHPGKYRLWITATHC